MQVTLRGSSASTVVSGILLLTHAKRLRRPIAVAVEGEPADVASVNGPALCTVPFSPVAALVGEAASVVCAPGRRLNFSWRVSSMEAFPIGFMDRAGTGFPALAHRGTCHHENPESKPGRVRLVRCLPLDALQNHTS